MTALAYPILDILLLGVIVACSFAAAVFFLRFWRDTHDTLFLAFAAFFLVQGGVSTAVSELPHPNEGSLWVFLLRLLSVLGVLAAILGKNSSRT